jgi:hypothetical protein
LRLAVGAWLFLKINLWPTKDLSPGASVQEGVNAKRAFLTTIVLMELLQVVLPKKQKRTNNSS